MSRLPSCTMVENERKGVGGGRSCVRTLIVLGIGVAFVVALFTEMPFANGTSLWRWSWRSLDPFLIGVPFIPSLVALGGVLWRLEREVNRRAIAGILALIVAANFLMQIAGVFAEPGGLGAITRIVMSPSATSYYSVAATINDVREWLSMFPTLDLWMHARTHPPGPVLFYYVCIRMFGPGAGATIGGCLVGLIGSLGIVVLYFLTRWWTRDVRRRLTICVFYALLPAMIVFFPEFDQAYSVIAMLMVFFWFRSLYGRLVNALWFGITLFAATFFAYNLLTMGLLIVLLSAWHMHRCSWRRDAWVAFRRAASLGVGACILLHLVVMVVFGYEPVYAFEEALATQKAFAAVLGRSYGVCVFFDPYDFALGAGILAVPLVCMRLWDGIVERRWGRTETVLSWMGVLTILVVDVTGLLRCETARVWLFLQWLLVVPAGLELSFYPRRARYAIFALQFVIIIVLKAKMRFIMA